MSPSDLGAMVGLLNLVFGLAIIAIGFMGIVKTRGRTRILVAGGIGALVLGRLVGLLVSAVVNFVPGFDNPGMAPFVIGQVLSELLTVAGVALLVVAAIVPARSAVSHPSAPAEVPQTPAGGWR